MTRKIIIFNILLTIISIVFLMPLVTSAQVIDPQAGGSGVFVPCSGTDCSACDLVKLGNSIIKWLISIVSLLFAVIMIVAGFRLVTSGGNQSARDGAKSMFTNALIGFIIILAAWLLVDTLMRALLGDSGELRGYGPWNEIECWQQREATIVQYSEDELLVRGIEPGSDEDPGVTSRGSGSIGCLGGTCVSLAPTPCSNQNSCKIAPDLTSRINRMHTQAAVNGARVTEAMPPTRTHKASCHQNGTCIDYSKSGGMSPTEVQKVIVAARANGLRPVYEVKTQAQKNTLVNGGVNASDIKVLGDWISGPHFSIYAN